MVILDRFETERSVRRSYRFCSVLFPARHSPDGIDILDNDIRLLMDSLEETELVLVCIDRVLEDTVLPQVGAGPAEVHCEFFEFGSALDPCGLFDKPEPRVPVYQFNNLFLGNHVLCAHLDRMHVHHCRRDYHCHRGDGYVREDGEDIRAMMTRYRYRIENNRIDRALLDLARVCPAPDHDGMDMSDAKRLVDLVDDPAEPGRIAGNNPYELPSDSIFVVAG